MTLFLVKLVFKFIFSFFDIVTDILSSLSFLGYYNINEGKVEINKIWGSIGLMIVFLPGFISGIFLMIDAGVRKEGWKTQLFFCFFGALFPIMFPSLQFAAIISLIYNKCKGNLITDGDSENNKLMNMVVTASSGVESSIESFCQIVLQIFTILNGYSSTTIQAVTIFSSFVQIGYSSISQDIELKSYFETLPEAPSGDINDGVSEWDWKKSVKSVYKRMKYSDLRKYISLLPCYVSTVGFRAGSFAITMAFLRLWSILPIAVLIIGLGYIGYLRSNRENLSGKLVDAAFFSVFNAGTMNAYTITHVLNKQNAESKGIEEQNDDKIVENFIIRSTWWTSIVHAICLSAIMICAKVNPDPVQFPHWSSEEFLLNPRKNKYFYWVFCTLLGSGFYSLTVLLYRARNIANTK